MADLHRSVDELRDGLRRLSQESGNKEYLRLAQAYTEILADAIAQLPRFQRLDEGVVIGQRRSSLVEEHSAAALQAVKAFNWAEVLRQTYMAIRALPGESAWQPRNDPPPPPPPPPPARQQ